MLLKVRGLHCPYDYQIHEFWEQGENDGSHERPDYRVSLGEAPWPRDVKEKIVGRYKQIGIEDPFKQNPLHAHF